MSKIYSYCRSARVRISKLSGCRICEVQYLISRAGVGNGSAMIRTSKTDTGCKRAFGWILSKNVFRCHVRNVPHFSRKARFNNGSTRVRMSTFSSGHTSAFSLIKGELVFRCHMAPDSWSARWFEICKK